LADGLPPDLDDRLPGRRRRRPLQLPAAVLAAAGVGDPRRRRVRDRTARSDPARRRRLRGRRVHTGGRPVRPARRLSRPGRAAARSSPPSGGEAALRLPAPVLSPASASAGPGRAPPSRPPRPTPPATGMAGRQRTVGHRPPPARRRTAPDPLPPPAAARPHTGGQGAAGRPRGAGRAAMGVREACDTVILAGGRADRMGGRDKPGLEAGGATLLERVAAAAP